MKSGRLKFRLVGNERALVIEIKEAGGLISSTIPNNRITVADLISVLEDMERAFAEPAEHPSPTEGSSEVQPEAGAEEA
jgi:hypothetical protein